MYCSLVRPLCQITLQTVKFFLKSCAKLGAVVYLGQQVAVESRGGDGGQRLFQVVDVGVVDNKHRAPLVADVNQVLELVQARFVLAGGFRLHPEIHPFVQHKNIRRT